MLKKTLIVGNLVLLYTYFLINNFLKNLENILLISNVKLLHKIYILKIE